jgi:membrane-bound ClpP family serine protease
MVAILLLFLAGIVLLALDIFAASFLLAAIGGAVMLAGCATAYRDFGVMGAGLAGLIALVLLGLTIYLELAVLPRTAFGRGLIVHSSSGSATQPPVAAEAVIGRTAAALTTLAPSGYVQLDGRRYEAFCQSGHADKGAELRVIGVDNFRVIVSK